MVTPPGVPPRLPAPAMGLALALSILITGLSVLPAGATPSRHGHGKASGKAGSGTQETTAGSGEGGGEGSAATPATGQAPGSGSAPVSGRPETGHERHHEPRPGPGQTPAERHAQRRAEREAARNEGHGGESGAGAQGNATPGAQGTTAKTKHEREREREQRKRERETRKEHEGKHETRKEREAREAREAEEAIVREHAGGQGGGVSSSITAPLATAATAPAPAASSQVASTIVSAPPSVVGQSRERSTGATGRKSHGAGRHAGGVGGASALLPVAAAGGAGAAVGRHGGGVPVSGKRSGDRSGQSSGGSSARGSTLVRTVTQIVGVIPGWLWGLLAGLGLLAAGLAMLSRVSAGRARRLTAQRAALLEDVGLLQAALLPELPERLGPLGTSAAYRPASGPGAGGDFYDVFALPDGLVGAIVGDVSGHGRSALPHTTLLRFTLRAYMEAGLSTREALRSAAPALERQLEGSFATVVLATYDPRRRLLRYSCAGHPHPLLSGLDPDAAIVACSAPPIGTGQPTGTRETVVSVPGEALACLFTDGVVEARVESGLYGRDRLAAALAAVESEGSAEDLLELVAEQTQRRPDDMAACLLRMSGGPERPRAIEETLVIEAREIGRDRTARFLAAAGVEEVRAARLLEEAARQLEGAGSVLLRIDVSSTPPRVSLGNDNVAPLRARALARDREVAL
jgi:hypothetical protein